MKNSETLVRDVGAALGGIFLLIACFFIFPAFLPGGYAYLAALVVFVLFMCVSGTVIFRARRTD
jgi:hypothetical protein